MNEASNPILRGFYPDPSVCRVGEDYYLVNSTFAYAPGVPIFHSRDLTHWQQIGNILDRREQLNLENAKMSDGIYAPTIRYHDGTFYMITTNVKGGGNFYVTAENPAGPWSNPVYLETAAGFDPSLFFDEDSGKCYYVGQRAKKEEKYPGDCEIWLQELDLEKGVLIGDDFSLWDGALKNAFWAEGPHIYKRNGYYYLLIAEGGTAFEHSICAARSQSLFGPYEPCPLNPVFTHRNLGRDYKIQNTGHGDLVETADGQWYIVMLGTRPIDGYAPLGRETFIAKTEWENDWPVINPGEGRIRDIQRIHLPAASACGIKNTEEMPVVWQEPLDCRCLFFRFPQEDMYNLREDGRIGLRLLPQTMEDPLSPSYVGIRVTSFDFDLKTTMEFYPEGKEEAGLVYLYDEKNFVKFVLTEKGMKTIIAENGKEALLFSRIAEKGRHSLGFHLEGLKLYCILDGEEFAEEIDVRNLTTEITYGFVGCTAGIYASCVHSSSSGINKEEKKYACFTELLF